MASDVGSGTTVFVLGVFFGVNTQEEASNAIMINGRIRVFLLFIMVLHAMIFLVLFCRACLRKSYLYADSSVTVSRDL